MKTTIEKRFDQLEPGDVLPGDDGYALVVYNVVDNGPGACRDVWCIETDRAAKVRSMTHGSSELFVVERRDLTPAQQHADELVNMLRELADRGSAGHVDHNSLCGRARTLFDKIDPPQPPTLAEALAALAEVHSHATTCGAFKNAGHVIGTPAAELLDRARRSGVLK